MNYSGLTTHFSICKDFIYFYFIGEILKMIQLAKGKDANGVLQLDIIVKGMAPPLPPRAHIKIEPYNEEYIQTGEGM